MSDLSKLVRNLACPFVQLLDRFSLQYEHTNQKIKSNQTLFSFTTVHNDKEKYIKDTPERKALVCAPGGRYNMYGVVNKRTTKQCW